MSLCTWKRQYKSTDSTNSTRNQDVDCRSYRSPNDPDATLFSNFSRRISISQSSDPSVGIFTLSEADSDVWPGSFVEATNCGCSWDTLSEDKALRPSVQYDNQNLEEYIKRELFKLRPTVCRFSWKYVSVSYKRLL